MFSSMSQDVSRCVKTLMIIHYVVIEITLPTIGLCLSPCWKIQFRSVSISPIQKSLNISKHFITRSKIKVIMFIHPSLRSEVFLLPLSRYGLFYWWYELTIIVAKPRETNFDGVTCWCHNISWSGNCSNQWCTMHGRGNNVW